MTSTFGKARFGATANGITPLSTGVPPAIYPGAVATNARLTVAVDRLQTRLAVPLGSGDTQMILQNGAGIVAACLLTIDDEIVQVLSGSGTTWQISRGFDGTTPALHLASSVVSGFIDAWHHNALAAEIEAIENALGPNLSKIPAAAFLISKAYNFPAQTPGGNLVVGANVITLSPVPAGVNGTDANHYLYISGGTGTAEAVRIIGGTAVSGASSGTVIVACAQAHSGPWTIATATAGTQEALVAGGPEYVQIWIPAGVYSWYAPVTVSGNGVSIVGAGMNTTTIYQQTVNSPVFVFGPGYYGKVTGMQLNAVGTHTSGYSIDLNTQNGAFVSRIFSNGFANGIRITDNNSTRIERCVFAPVSANGDGIFITGNGTNVVRIDQCDAVGSGGNYRVGLHIQGSGGLSIYGSKFMQAQYGCIIDPGNGQSVGAVDMANCDFDSNTIIGMWIHPSGTGNVNELRLTSCWFSSSGSGSGLKCQPVSGGIVNGMTIIGSPAYINGEDGFRIEAGSNIRILDCPISDNGRSVAGNGVTVLSGVVNIKIQNNHIGNNLDGNVGTNSQVYGVYWVPGSSGEVTGNTFSGHSTAPMNWVIGPTDGVFAGSNLGVDNLTVAVVSATNIDNPASGIPNLQITGTTTITTIAHPYSGRRITLYKTDAGSVTVGGGGNIPIAHTLAQFGSLTLFSDGANWY